MDFSTTPQIFDNDGNIDYKAHAEAGFKGIDFQHFTNFQSKVLDLNNQELAKFCKNELKRAKETGVVIHQLHSFWVWPPQPYDVTAEAREKEIKYYKMAIRGAHMMECKYVAIHHRVPFDFEDSRLNEEAYNSTIDFMKKLVPYARKYRVTLCLENLPFPQETYGVYKTVEIIKKVNSKYCRMCLDTGHANVTEKSFYDAFNYAKDFIKIFHVHDNDGQRDNHWNPYKDKGTINWKNFAKVLKAMNYKGMVSSETGIEKTKDRQLNIERLKNYMIFSKK